MDSLKHYVYKIEDVKTGEFYFGSRSCECNPLEDDYMGSPYAWNPNINNLKKTILGLFETREKAIEREALLIESMIDYDLNRNYHIPNKGFHTKGNREVAKKISEANKGKVFTKSHKRKLSEAKKEWIKENGHPMKGKFGKNHWRYGKGYPEKSKEMMSEKISGENNPMYGMTGSLNPFYGKSHSNETKKIISEKASEWYDNIKWDGSNNPFYGKSHNKRAREKMSKAHKSKIMHIKTKKIFNTMREAGEHFNLSPATISGHCNGNVSNSKFRFINE